MAKKTKGKQKDEKGATSGIGSSLPPPTNNAMGAVGTEAHFRANSPVETSGWGNAPGAWGIADAPAATDTWGMSKNEPGDAWDEHAGSLLQPPGPAHGILPTIPEQASENYNQFRRSLSDIGESRESQDYSTSFSASQDSPDTRYAEVQGQQSQTVTATAAPSAMGSPAPPPTISITEAFSKVNAAGLVGQKMTSASEAARRQEEQRSRLHAQPAKTTTISPAVHYEPLKDHLSHMAGGHTPMSSASAAAALFESTSNKLRAQNNKPPQPSVPAAPGKTTWTYPKPLTPGARLPAAIPPDPSWTMTGGNAWSNKHRQTKSATVHWPQGSENAWSHHPPQHSQQHAQNGHPQGLAVGPSPAQNRPQHQKNNSHPHPTHTAFQQASSAQHTHWQGWGKEKWPQEESESDSEDETMDGEWDNGEGWSQQNGGGWNQQNGGGWNQQNGGGWNQHSGGRGQQKQHHGHNRKGDPTQTGQGRGGKQPEDPRAQDTAWGRQNGNWDQGGTAWGQHNDDWSQGQGRGQVQGQGQGRGQGQGIGQPRSDNAWHQQEDIGWGQDSGWGKAEGDPGAWGKPNSEAGWGRENSEWQPGRTSPIEWATGQPKKGAHGDSDPAKNQMSEHHRNQIMNAMVPQTLKNSNMTTAQLQAAHLRTAQQQAHLAARGQISPDPKAKEGNVWEAYDADNGWGSMDSGDEEYDANRRVHFEPKASGLWGGSPHSVPSKTLAYAQQQQGMATTPINLASAVRFVESKGAAFSFVNHAFFGNVRLARERIHWMFPPNKDERVANMLAWVQKMSFNLATFGLIKFLQTRERGALFLNAVFRMHHFPSEPALDWLTFDQLQSTMDKTLQESAAFYDPSRLVTVFVYLPSQTGNSVAIWRRKINVPDSAKIKYQAEIAAVVKNLRQEKDYVLMVDEVPKARAKVPQKGQLRKSLKKTTKPIIKDTQGKTKKKRKWWKLFLC